MSDPILDTPIRTKRAYTRRFPRSSEEPPPPDVTGAIHEEPLLEARIAALELAVSDLTTLAVGGRGGSDALRRAWRRMKADEDATKARRQAERAARDLP